MYSTAPANWATVGESLHIQRSCWESETDFSLNSRLYIILKLPYKPYVHTASPTQCLFFIGHSLHPCNTCSPLVTAYTHAFFYASDIMPTYCLFFSSHFVDLIYGRMYLSTPPTKFIAGQGNILHFYLMQIICKVIWFQVFLRNIIFKQIYLIHKCNSYRYFHSKSKSIWL